MLLSVRKGTASRRAADVLTFNARHGRYDALTRGTAVLVDRAATSHVDVDVDATAGRTASHVRAGLIVDVRGGAARAWNVEEVAI